MKTKRDNFLTWVSAGLASVILIAVSGTLGWAHSTDESYIWLDAQSDRLNGRVEFRLDDLRKYFDLDVPQDVAAAREFVNANRKKIEAYIQEKFQLHSIDGSVIPYHFVNADVLENDVFGHFAQFFYSTDPMDSVPTRVVVKSRLLFEHDKYSRCLICMDYNHFTGKEYPESFFHAIFSPWNDEQEIDFEAIEAVKRGRKYYVWEGIRHIWIGIDHILFLVSLLLASVLVKRKASAPTANDTYSADEKAEPPHLVSSEDQWVPVEGFAGAFWNIFKIVTIFTVAHSITLALASLDIISLPSRLVESIIALSIVLVAVNNIVPTFRDRTWIILFLFGLFHGLGFASVMKNLPFRMPSLTTLLVCFNIGVELGQLVIVAAVFPILFLLRKTSFYKPVVLIGGSVVLIVIAGYWFVERAMGWG